MKGMDKIKMLKEILADKDLMSDKILKEKPEGELIVSAEGDSPEDAKETLLAELEGAELPDESDMDEMEDEMCEEDLECDSMMDSEDEEEEDFDEDMLEDEDKDILEMLPMGQRKEFKKRLIEKIKSL